MLDWHGPKEIHLPTDPNKIKCNFLTIKCLTWSPITFLAEGGRRTVEDSVTLFFQDAGGEDAGTLFFDGKIWRII
jgi:hypothetical protein